MSRQPSAQTAARRVKSLRATVDRRALAVTVKEAAVRDAKRLLKLAQTELRAAEKAVELLTEGTNSDA